MELGWIWRMMFVPHTLCLSWWLTSTAATSPLQRHPLGSDRSTPGQTLAWRDSEKTTQRMFLEFRWDPHTKREINSIYRVRWMGSEPQRGQSFQSLGATGLTGLNLWILKLHIRADETLNLSDGGRVEGLGECVSKSQSQLLWWIFWSLQVWMSGR